MTAKPTDHHPQLADARLRVIAETLLEVLYETELEMDTPLDDGYTRGTAVFGRQRNALIGLCTSGKHAWLKLRNAGMDLTFEIEGVPCRFFADDPENPKKPGFWRRNAADSLIPIEVGHPEMFRFVVEKARDETQEAEVRFIGYDALQQEVFNWSYSMSTPTLFSTDTSRPAEVNIPEPEVTRPRGAGDAEAAASGDNEPA